jgi:hypothetical protein
MFEEQGFSKQKMEEPMSPTTFQISNRAYGIDRSIHPSAPS